MHISKLRYDFYKSLLADLGSDAARNVKIGCSPDLSHAECFYIERWSDVFGCKIPYYFTLPEIQRIEGDFSRLYGRTPWGPWCYISMYRCEIFEVKILRDTEHIERIAYLKEYIRDFKTE